MMLKRMLSQHQRSLIFLFFFYFLYGLIMQHVTFASSLGGSLVDHFDDYYLSKRRLETEEPFKPLEPMPKCVPSPPCEQTRVFNKYEISPQYAMSNSEEKILMELSPKASCTSAVMMFLKSMGFEYGIHYMGWPHDFRFRYYYSHCGMNTPCMYSDNYWIRFKVVRNPFDRAVSSYIHCMKTDLLDKHIFHGNQTKFHLFTFENFVDFLANLRSRTSYEHLAQGHFKIQSTEFEVDYFRTHGKSLFHVIIKIEEPNESIQLLNRLIQERAIHYSNMRYKNLTFALEDLPETVKHYVARTKETHAYVGNLSWTEIKHRIPSTYRYFFREPYISKLKKIYEDDLYLYNYTFPYPIDNWEDYRQVR